jgi:hypothetical protein
MLLLIGVVTLNGTVPALIVFKQMENDNISKKCVGIRKPQSINCMNFAPPPPVSLNGPFKH